MSSWRSLGRALSGLADRARLLLEVLGDRLAQFSALQRGGLAAGAVLLLLLQSAMLLRPDGDAPPPVMSLPAAGPPIGGPGAANASAGTFAIISFRPTATASEITKLLEQHKAEIVEGPKAGIWRVRLSPASVGKDEAHKLLDALRTDRLVTLAILAL